MADTIQILGQQAPAAATATTLCTGSTNGTSVSSISVCNTNSSSITFRVWLRVGAASDSFTTQALFADMTLAANDTYVATIGLTLASSDNIRVQTNTANVVFMAFGVNT